MIRDLRILCLEDNAADVELIERELERAGIQAAVMRVDDGEAFAGALTSFEPDIVLSDHGLPRFTLTDAIKTLQSVRPATPLVVVTGSPDAVAAVALVRAGAADYVAKSMLGRLPATIESALQKRAALRELTPRQLQVLQLVATGSTTPEIARRLSISVKTVETHRSEVMSRLGIHDLVGLVRYCIGIGLAPLDQ